MIPAGYMFKFVSALAGEVTAANVIDFFSAGACGSGISPCFAEYIPYWKHNGYWFFNSPDVMIEIARQNGIDLAGMTLFFYEIYEFECDKPLGHDELQWIPFQCEPSFTTDVLLCNEKILAGYDVVEFSLRNSPECSLLSCCNLAEHFDVNSHCLFDTFEEAKKAVESGQFHDSEPGPYRILAVYVCS